MRTETTPQIVMFYPCSSMADQLQSWSNQRGGQHLQLSFERTLAGIRRKIYRADFVLIDATGDSAQASDAFFQIQKTIGSDGMAVYTEIVHDGLEILVRRLGVTFLLGPMSLSEWENFFMHKFPQIIPLPLAVDSPQNPSSEQKSNDDKPVAQTYPVKSIAG